MRADARFVVVVSTQELETRRLKRKIPLSEIVDYSFIGSLGKK